MSWDQYPAQKLANQSPWNKNRATWMTQLPDFLLVRDLSIPGTHDSSALQGYLYQDYERSVTQRWGIEDQLNNGLRFLDLRVAFDAKPWGLRMVHACDDIYDPTCHPVDTSKPYHYKAVISTCAKFLKQNPEEGIIVSVKLDCGKDGDGEPVDPSRGFGGTVEDWFRQIANEVAFDNHTTWDTMWDVRPTVDATLKDLRGKLLLWRRFERGGNYQGTLGLDLTALNSTYDDTEGAGWATPDGAHVYAQDCYQCTAYNKFMRWCATMWDAYNGRNIGSPNGDSQYLNFTTVGGVPGINPPSHYAKPINDALKVWLDFWHSQCPHQQPNYCFRSGIGVVPMDFPTHENIDLLIDANFVKTLRFDNGDPSKQAFMANAMKNL